MAEKDNMQADVIWGVGATNQLVFKNAGLLVPYAPKGLDRIQPLFRDKANPPSWVGIDIYMSAFCFNTEVGKKHNLPAPTSWADLAKPVYKGHVVMPNPASSGTGYLSVASVLQRMGEAEGWKYLDAIHPNMAEYTKSGSKPCKDAAAGERAIGVSFEYVALEMKKKGAPVEMVLPKEGSGYEMEANALTRKGARNPAAKQFLDWGDRQRGDGALREVLRRGRGGGVPGAGRPAQGHQQGRVPERFRLVREESRPHPRGMAEALRQVGRGAAAGEPSG